MKSYISLVVLLIAVLSLGIWDGTYTQKVFDHMKNESGAIYESLLSTEITDENLQNQINDLNDYWTEKMDVLCISISRKDLQVVSDYLQYLCSSIINENQEDAITYSRLLNYNIIGLGQTTGINFINIL